MASLSSRSLQFADSNPQTSFSIDRRTRMLKDFLDSDLNSSCSSSGFRSFPRKPFGTTVRNLIDLDINTSNSKFELQRSRSSRTGSVTISAIHKASEIFINAVKNLQFSTVKSPSVLHRSITRRLSRRKFRSQPKAEAEMEKVTVKVKDILRWRSFRDLIEEKPPPVDLSSSTTTTGSTSITTNSSNGSSWCDSDFTAEDSPYWCDKSDEFGGEDEGKMGRKSLPDVSVGGDSLNATTGVTVDPKEELSSEEKEQQSPVSVLDFPFAEDDDESRSSFHQSLDSMQRKEHMIMQNNQEFEGDAELERINLEKEFQEAEEANGYEEKAKRLLSHVKATSSAKSCEAKTDSLLLNFFRNELESSNQNGDGFDSEIVRIAKAWIDGKYDGEFEWEIYDQRHAYIRDMERGVRWSKFREEQEQLALEMEIGILNNLLDEILVDLLVH